MNRGGAVRDSKPIEISKTALYFQRCAHSAFHVVILVNGAPQTAMSSSPMNLSRVPSWRKTISTMISKNSEHPDDLHRLQTLAHRSESADIHEEDRRLAGLANLVKGDRPLDDLLEIRDSNLERLCRAIASASAALARFALAMRSAASVANTVRIWRSFSVNTPVAIRVSRNHPEEFCAGHQGHAHCAANALHDDTVTTAEATIHRCITREDRIVLGHYLIENGARQVEVLIFALAIWYARGSGTFSSFNSRMTPLSAPENPMLCRESGSVVRGRYHHRARC